MKIKLIKLIQNELIKIFKRRSSYILFIILVVAIIAFNYITLNENNERMASRAYLREFEPVLNLDSEEIGTEGYASEKSAIDFYNLYNKYEKNSWQRYALNEERKTTYGIGDFPTEFYKDVEFTINTINDYEYNYETEVNEQEYSRAKEKYEEYIKVLDDGGWKQFVSLKIKNLEEIKNQFDTTSDESKSIDIEIELYQYRLQYNIEFKNDILNEYIENLRQSQYLLEYHNSNPTYYKESIELETKNVSLYKYAIENKIEFDISSDSNLILGNTLNARTLFLRTFENFNILVIITVIYISSNIITEERNKGTIKNLLIKPHKRVEILISKILACIITVIITMIFIVLIQYIVGGIIFGFDSYSVNYIGYNYNNNQVFTMNLFQYSLIEGLAKLSMYIFVIIFCIFIGTVNSNIIMTMILILITFIICSTAIAEWSKYEGLTFIAKYFITNNWDFSKYLFGASSNLSGQTPLFSLVVYLVYTLLLLYLTINRFTRKDVYNE